MSHQRGQRHVNPQEVAIPGFGVPANFDDWWRIVQRGRLEQRSIHHLSSYYLNSGSQVNHRQFTLMRVLFPPLKGQLRLDQELAIYGLRGTWSQANSLLNSSAEAAKYLRMVRDDLDVQDLSETHQNWPGSFKSIRMLQQQTMTVDQIHDRERMPSPTTGQLGVVHQMVTRSRQSFAHFVRGTGSSARAEWDLPEAEDESTPNAALIVLLQGVSQLVADSGVEWVFNRELFSPVFASGGYRAYSDGVLRSTTTGAVMAIVEVKKGHRGEPGMIEMQEAAEMVGWMAEQQRDHTGRLPNFNNQ